MRMQYAVQAAKTHLSFWQSDRKLRVAVVKHMEFGAQCANPI